MGDGWMCGDLGLHSLFYFCLLKINFRLKFMSSGKSQIVILFQRLFVLFLLVSTVVFSLSSGGTYMRLSRGTVQECLQRKIILSSIMSNLNLGMSLLTYSVGFP